MLFRSDATAPTQAATTPGSIYTSSCRARSLSGDRTASRQHSPKHKFQQGKHNDENSTSIPNCVSFSDDTLSVESNLPSPKLLKRTTTDEDDDTNPDVELYKDFKMFQSLAIPADDEIDEYHQSRVQEVKQ